ncbi:thrombospondin type 1 domain protein [Onchocerca flexuosa]|uniref:Zinc metalloproteinase n=1 Tax=Onchocerca flexuosa TaxID=387005 RepID=A0A238BRH4_9BILA|nr:thrombospondin type 1 domain protein [Onchocerca flexuosa]
MASNGCQGKICNALERRDEGIVSTSSDNIFMSFYNSLLNQFYEKTAQKFGVHHDYDSKKVSKDLKNIPIDDGTEASINRNQGVAGHLFENDIVLTLPQVKALLNENTRSRSNRQAIRGTEYYWMNMPIPYYFGSSNGRWQNIIRAALRHIETETCVRFKENGYGQNYLYFVKAEGCWSGVGKKGGRQSISIGRGCEVVGIVAHEVLHALGLWHEQSRDDRDSKITINYAYIYPNTQGNFEKRSFLTSDNMGLPYDFGSVMHYGSKAFTVRHDRNTIETRDPRYQKTIGQRQAISFKDAKMINLRYCNDKCRNRINCYNGGYNDPNNCGRCKCPTGFGGIDCLSVQKSRTTNCGGDLIADDSDQIITSTGLYGHVHCVWRITSKAQVAVFVSELRLPCEYETCTNYLELKSKANMIETGSRHCCGPSQTWITSENNTLIVIYSTEDYSPGSWGFTVHYKMRKHIQKPMITLQEGKRMTKREMLSLFIRQITHDSDSRWRPSNKTWPPPLPEKAITTPPTTTTTKLITTTKETSMWSEWGKWSLCSTTCGGCGKQRRVRACYGQDRNCPGPKEEMRKCGEKRCLNGTSFDCITRLVMPCNLYQMLEFATDKNANAPLAKNPMIDPQKFKQHIKSAFSSEQLCEKHIHHSCSTTLRTVYLDRKIENNKSWSRLDRRGCCPGYYFNGTICVPD